MDFSLTLVSLAPSNFSCPTWKFLSSLLFFFSFITEVHVLLTQAWGLSIPLSYFINEPNPWFQKVQTFPCKKKNMTKQSLRYNSEHLCPLSYQSSSLLPFSANFLLLPTCACVHTHTHTLLLESEFCFISKCIVNYSFNGYQWPSSLKMKAPPSWNLLANHDINFPVLLLHGNPPLFYSPLCSSPRDQANRAPPANSIDRYISVKGLDTLRCRVALMGINGRRKRKVMPESDMNEVENVSLVS